MPSRQSNVNIKATLDSILACFGMSVDLLTNKANADELFGYMKMVDRFTRSFYMAIKLKYRQVKGVKTNFYKYWSVNSLSTSLDRLIYQGVLNINECREMYLSLQSIGPGGEIYRTNLNAISLDAFAAKMSQEYLSGMESTNLTQMEEESVGTTGSNEENSATNTVEDQQGNQTRE